MNAHLELALCLDVFGEVGGDGLVELVEYAHGEHRVDVAALDQLVERIRQLHPNSARRKSSTVSIPFHSFTTLLSNAAYQNER